MYSTSVYYYIPRQTVVLNIGNSVRRYKTVYAKNLKLHRGVDNRLQFQFINQEQKPVDITDKDITIRILNHEGNKVLLQRLLVPTLTLNGLTELWLDSTDLDEIEPQMAYYTLEIPVDQFDLPVFVDGDAGARGKLQIVDSVLPSFVPSQIVGVLFPSTTEPYFSEVAVPTSSSSTFAVTYTGYTGTVQVQGSTTRTDWYDIDSAYTYTDETSTATFNVDGFHPYIKLKFVSSAGTVDSILLR